MKATQAARRLDAVFAATVNGILVADGDGHIERANDRAGDIFGVPKEELLGPMAESAARFRLRTPAGEIAPIPLGVRALCGEVIQPIERIITRPDGVDRHLRAGAAPLRDAFGRIEGAVIVFDDISDTKQAEARVRELNHTLEERVEERTRELQEALDELNAFAYTVAHDLRAPLRSMHAFSDLLLLEYRDRPLDAQGQGYLERIRAASRRMDDLIQGILAYSRLGQTESPLQTVELSGVVTAALGEIADLQADVAIQAPLPTVRGNRLFLVQVISNLLSNAIKFVAPGVRPRVDVTCRVTGSRARLFIKDNGIGIAEEHHQRIFGVFERLNARESYPGTGIGLAIVRRAVERMGGCAGVESRPGEGSTFWIDLPAAG